MMTTKRRSTLTEERFRVLEAQLREAKRLKTIPKRQADEILENACNARDHLTPALLKRVGEALSKTEGIENLPSDPDPSLTRESV